MWQLSSYFPYPFCSKGVFNYKNYLEGQKWLLLYSCWQQKIQLWQIRWADPLLRLKPWDERFFRKQLISIIRKLIAKLRPWHQTCRTRIRPIFTWRLVAVTHSSLVPNQPIELKLCTQTNFRTNLRIQFSKKKLTAEQLSTDDNSCWQLMEMKITLKSWKLAHITPLGCEWKLHLFFFVTAVISCQH